MRRWPKGLNKLSCAVFHIETDSGHGTGFFVGGNGEFVTAAHVIADRKFSINADKKLVTTVVLKDKIRIRQDDGTDLSITLGPLSRDDGARATADLFKSTINRPTPCHLKIATKDTLDPIGAHLIAMGYPNLTPSLALYDGFLSSRYKHLPQPMGYVGALPVYPEYDVLRVQMPITPGASGSPLIANGDYVIGVISEIPVSWTDDLTTAVSLFGKDTPGISIGDFNITKAVIDLAFVVRQFESPGAALAVPVSYLNPPAR